MAEVSSNGAAITSRELDKPVTAAAEAGEVVSASGAGASTSASVDEIKTTAPETAETVAPSAGADDKIGGGETTETNGDLALSATATNGAPDSAKKQMKRKSITGVPEHKNKKLNRKKSIKALPTVHLDVEPGQYWYVRMKGHPPWPSIICDEEMLPESLLSKRPVSAANVDGSYRPDYQEGGKNAKDRRYPVMFLYTNEFAWQVNTELQPLDMKELKEIVANEDKGKKSKNLWEAYIVAAEDHDLDYYKNLLRQHEQTIIEEQEAVREAEAKKAEAQAKRAERKAEKKAVKAEKAAKKEKRKNAAKAKKLDEDEEMPDADVGEASTKRKSNKRKKTEESEGEGAKPAKTPKVLKVNGPKDKEESTPKSKKIVTKPKKSKGKEEEPEETAKQPEEKPLTEAEKNEKLFKTVLYLRHKLQKGFINRDQEPKAEEMDLMNEQFKQLEAIERINSDIIKRTKIHKVLKAIIKLTSIPKEETHEFKRRSTDLLQEYNKILTADGAAGDTGTSAEPTTNGVSKADGSHSPAAKETAKDNSGDVPMAGAAPESRETKPAVDGAELSKPEGVTEPVTA